MWEHSSFKGETNETVLMAVPPHKMLRICCHDMVVLELGSLCSATVATLVMQ